LRKLLRKKLPIILLAIFFPWIMLTFVIPTIALGIFKLTENQTLGYIAVLVGFTIFLIVWYQLSKFYLKKNLEFDVG